MLIYIFFKIKIKINTYNFKIPNAFNHKNIAAKKPKGIHKIKTINSKNDQFPLIMSIA